MIEQQLFEPAGMTRSRVVLGTLARDWRTFWYERFSVFYQEYGPTVATATNAVRVRVRKSDRRRTRDAAGSRP
jgi:hypothetical protein